MYSMNKDGKVKWTPIEARETEKRELPVDNVVRRYFISYTYIYAGTREFRNCIIEHKLIKTQNDIDKIEKSLSDVCKYATIVSINELNA